ncbi:MAG: Ca-activated chloride channel family protein [Planctomycetota bacterium]|jgi:Ca-activated chloride channel family protein
MKRLLPSLLLLLSCPVFSNTVAAQGLLIGPNGSGGQTQSVANHNRALRAGVHIVGTKINADIVDGVATTTIDQTIRNTGRRDAEGIWFLPLPAGAVADGFTMTVGGKEITGEVLDAGQARSVYESIVRRKRDPGLLEYAGEGMLRARIYPIPANGEVGVTVRLRQVLVPTGGMYEWSFPLGVAKLGDAASGPVGLEVRIESQTALGSVVTPHRDAAITRKGEHKASVSLEGSKGELEDLRVLYGLSKQEFGLHLLPYRMQGEPGYFTMLLSPPRTLAADKVPARLVQLVVDTSGSMKGDKIMQAKASLHTFLKSLRPEDRFQIVTFASAVQTFFPSPRLATPENIKAAIARVDTLEAMGGTNIGDALREALEAATPDGDSIVAVTQIVFITDGQPTVGLTKPNQILELTKQADKARTRIFALGVGDQIDVRLLDDLVAQHHGARDFVGNKEKIEAKVDALCQKISRPALSDVVVKCEGLDAFHVHPTKTRDLFCGEMMQVVGRYRDHGQRTVRVSGTQNGKPKEFVFEVNFPKAAAKHSFVQTLWARQHVTGLLQSIRRNGQKAELMQELRQLATRYGIVTPYTSQLILEEGMRLAGKTARRDRSYRGPGDAVPPSGGGGGRFGRGPSTGRPSGPITGGLAGPSAPRPSGPATGGPSGPSTGGPAGPSAPRAARGGRAPVAKPRGLANLGKKRTGKAAVAESKSLSGSDDFFFGSTRRTSKRSASRESSQKDPAELLYRAAGRVFVGVGADLVEQGLPKDWRKQVVVVESFSSDYFTLLKQKPHLAKVLALGERVVFRDGKRIVHVRPADPKPVKPSKTSVDKKAAPTPVKPGKVKR